MVNFQSSSHLIHQQHLTWPISFFPDFVSSFVPGIPRSPAFPLPLRMLFLSPPSCFSPFSSPTSSCWRPSGLHFWSSDPPPLQLPGDLIPLPECTSLAKTTCRCDISTWVANGHLELHLSKSKYLLFLLQHFLPRFPTLVPGNFHPSHYSGPQLSLRS